MATKIKITLVPEPTFPATVAIPIPGDTPDHVAFTFKWINRDEFKKFADGLAGRDMTDVVMEIATNWELTEGSFCRENVERLLGKYMGAGTAILDKYISELTNARLGN